MVMNIPNPNCYPLLLESYDVFSGVAEPIRFIFAQAGVPYEDVRIEKTDWPALKPSN